MRRCGSCGAPSEHTEKCVACGVDPNVGRIVGGKFRVDRRLGAGGMSSVYAGVHLELGEPVAIKFLRRELALDPTLRKRFRREAVALARLRHPGIVSILDFGDIDDELYAVMELVAGRTLDEVAGGRPIPLARAGVIFDQLLAALEICHAGGVVHRDLKPGNVMVVTHEGADAVKLIDFGIAHASLGGDEKLTSTGLVHGTPEYMSPEQCRGEDVFAATDIYAVGVMLYQLLTGSRPYDADNAAALMAQHLFVDPRPMRSIEPSVPVGIEALVRRAMAKAASERPTARELRHELASVLEGTDLHSLAAASTSERQRTLALGRDERALTQRPPGFSLFDVELPLPDSTRALLWMPRGPRGSDVQSALAIAGIRLVEWSDEDPTAALTDDARLAVILSARHDGLERLRRLRASLPRLPAVVIDVSGPEETTAAIRAGASDFSLEGSADAELGRKLSRLWRRHARRNS
ncbi:serine/threonine-protein kinase [Labilithrix luteola]|nr:serine/threonine-protein kinase [Labilithrix luteola]